MGKMFKNLWNNLINKLLILEMDKLPTINNNKLMDLIEDKLYLRILPVNLQ